MPHGDYRTTATPSPNHSHGHMVRHTVCGLVTLYWLQLRDSIYQWMRFARGCVVATQPTEATVISELEEQVAPWIVAES